ncbi:hypothetical protein SMKI_03G0640 [Saccharomyces mikatae IFO 1815]|uniref:non-specific serine/threonine protein kinase n=1 Tax=Saccharomyces mikatae IFO 1815 TaxID=226126 RepID=A0AA35NGV8_SACMI|nr:uncharacterized protein SMKI_03G0640 [Saccharomyces mikatae IFO 1815]CAI4037590.1 hypothetical protein SMKI_03G0640 [Saccharomyces mikatae IFO 1815]
MTGMNDNNAAIPQHTPRKHALSSKVMQLFRSGSRSSRQVKPSSNIPPPFNIDTNVSSASKSTKLGLHTPTSATVRVTPNSTNTVGVSKTGIYMPDYYQSTSPSHSSSSASLNNHMDINTSKSSSAASLTSSVSALSLSPTSAINTSSKSLSPKFSHQSNTNTVFTPAPTTSASSINNVNKITNTSAPVCGRFLVHKDGTHEHHLKNAKRQEKLSTMIKNIVGASKLRGEAKSAVPDIIMDPKTTLKTTKNPPSLFAGFMKQVADMDDKYPEGTPVSGTLNSSERDIYKPDQKDSGNNANSTTSTKRDTQCFAEKYGRCQEVLGKGAFGVVRICQKKNVSSQDGNKSEKLYAVKEFKRRASESVEKYSKRLTSEFCISSSLHHTNIVNTLDLFQDAKGEYCEVMEYCAGGDLFTLVIAAGKLEYMEADCFFKQLIRGVVYMHEMGVCHRDLKPENLLLTHDGVLKITDFGNSECFKMAWEKNIHLSGGICGSSPYIAPEEYIKEEFDPRPVDIWACGVIYMAMRTGRQLWSSAEKEDPFYMNYLKGRKEKGGYEPIESLKRARCRNVIYSMLDPVPYRRINGKQILNSEWGREIKCCHNGRALK